MGDFKELRAWREAKRLAVLSKPAIAKLPRDERYALGDEYLTEPELQALRITRANCARLVYGLLPKMSDRSR